MADIETTYIGEAVYISNSKFGFLKDNIYKIKIIKELKRGYLVSSNYNISLDEPCSAFCPYSSLIMIKRDWRF